MPRRCARIPRDAEGSTCPSYEELTAGAFQYAQRSTVVEPCEEGNVIIVGPVQQSRYLLYVIHGAVSAFLVSKVPVSVARSGHHQQLGGL